MKKYIIEENVVLAIIKYLSARPWAEVQEVMPVLRNLQEHKEVVIPEVVEEKPNV